jgi:hypothetical protein
MRDKFNNRGCHLLPCEATIFFLNKDGRKAPENNCFSYNIAEDYMEAQRK